MYYHVLSCRQLNIQVFLVFMNAKYLRKNYNSDTNGLLVYDCPVNPTIVVGTPRLQLPQSKDKYL